MKLMNMLTKASYPMKNVCPYTLFKAELAIDKSDQSVEWLSQSNSYEAVLLRKPRIEVLEASKEGNSLLHECSLEIRVDRAIVSGSLALMEENPSISMGEGRGLWFGAVEGDDAKGIFLPNGSIVQAIVKCPIKIESIPRIRITIEAELYTSERAGSATLEPWAKTAAEISELILKTKHQSLSMADTASLVRHSVICTASMCLGVDLNMAPECSCGNGIRP